MAEFDTYSGSALQAAAEITSLADEATETLGSTFALDDDSLIVVDAEILVTPIGAVAAAKVFNTRRVFRVDGSTVTAETQEDLTGPQPSPSNSDLDVTVSITNTGAVGRIDVTNDSGDPVRVRGVRQVHVLSAGDGFDPFAVAHGAVLGFLEGGYARPVDAGTWTAEVGSNATCASNAPPAVSGSPDFNSGDDELDCADTVASWWGTGERYGFAVIDFDAINSDVAYPYQNEGIFSDAAQYVGLYAWYTGTKGVNAGYFVTHMDYEQGGAPCYATVDITSFVDQATGAGQVTIQWRKLEGELSIKVDGEEWESGVACGNTATAAQSQTLKVGSDYNGTLKLDGRLRALGFYLEVKDNGWADDLVTWAGTVLP